MRSPASGSRLPRSWLLLNHTKGTMLTLVPDHVAAVAATPELRRRHPDEDRIGGSAAMLSARRAPRPEHPYWPAPTEQLFRSIAPAQ
jgi:hypothetical protein